MGQDAPNITNLNATKDIVTSKSADATLTVAETGTILVSASAANRTMTLPTAVGYSGLRYVIKKTDATANTVTVDGNASETIDGNATVVLRSQNSMIEIVSDGSNWQIKSSNVIGL